jgi:hypothetical protein
MDYEHAWLVTPAGHDEEFGTSARAYATDTMEGKHQRSSSGRSTTLKYLIVVGICGMRIE